MARYVFNPVTGEMNLVLNDIDLSTYGTFDPRRTAQPWNKGARIIRSLDEQRPLPRKKRRNSNPVVQVPKSNINGEYYTVRKGDTFYDILKNNGIKTSDMQRIAKANGIKDIDRIFVGQKIKLPGFKAKAGTEDRKLSETVAAQEAAQKGKEAVTNPTKPTNVGNSTPIRDTSNDSQNENFSVPLDSNLREKYASMYGGNKGSISTRASNGMLREPGLKNVSPEFDLLTLGRVKPLKQIYNFYKYVRSLGNKKATKSKDNIKNDDQPSIVLNDGQPSINIGEYFNSRTGARDYPGINVPGVPKGQLPAPSSAARRAIIPYNSGGGLIPYNIGGGPIIPYSGGGGLIPNNVGATNAYIRRLMGPPQRRLLEGRQMRYLPAPPPTSSFGDYIGWSQRDMDYLNYLRLTGNL